MTYFKCVDNRDSSVTYFELNKSLLSIGSKDGNDIVLKGPEVAATHANLFKKKEGYQINLLDRSKRTRDGSSGPKRTSRRGYLEKRARRRRTSRFSLSRR